VTRGKPPREWWARRGEGAWRDGERLPDLDPGPLDPEPLERLLAEL